MQKKIDPYTLSLLRQNTIVLIILLLSVILIVIVLPLRVMDLLQNREKSDTLKTELSLLRDRQRQIESVSNVDIDSASRAINYLIPTQEDFMTVLTSIDELQSQSGVKITTTLDAINLEQTEAVKLNVTVEAPSALLVNFLSQYHYRSGRLITTDSISITGAKQTMTLMLHFYVKKADFQSGVVSAKVDPVLIDRLKTIYAEIDRFGSSNQNTQEADDVEYTGKTNPFN